MGSFLLFLLLLALALLIAGVLNGFLAPLKVHIRIDPTSAFAAIEEQDTPFVGLALSGGGARAAVFAAAGMKALNQRGLLDAVTHVSSVSGGGFPASYLALHPVPKVGAEAYFDQMQDVVAHDYFRDVQLQQARKPRRAFSPSHRLTSLQEALDRPDFVRGATFADLPDDRVFFFNTVSYDTGRRCTLSNGALPAPDARDTLSVLPPSLRSMSFSNAEERRAAPTHIPVSLAVATSAAFPPYLGPMTVEVAGAARKAHKYWHLGDGGVFENSGAETLREAIYACGPGQSATIYGFDAGMQLNSDLSENTLDISIWSRDVTRLVDVLSEYADAHRENTFHALDREHGMKIAHIKFNYMDISRLVKAGELTDPRWLSWDGWENATPAERSASATPAEHLAKIPTALKISPGNRDLITAAAETLVDLRFPQEL